MESKKQITTIDEYIDGYPQKVKDILTKIRKIIQEAAPEAKEAISYQMPTFKWNGNLIHFAGFKNHIGLYPTPSGIESFKEEIAPYRSGKGSIQFPLDQEIPYDLIQKIVLYRVKETREKNKKEKRKDI